VNDIKPTTFLEVWRSPIWGLAWAVRSFTTVKQFNDWYEYHEHFYGKTATVHAGTQDYDISREELLSVAINHVQGHCVTYQFDLKNCIVTKIDGRPSTPEH